MAPQPRSGCRAALAPYLLLLGLLCMASTPQAHGREQAAFAVAAAGCATTPATVKPATAISGYTCKQQAWIAASELERILKASMPNSHCLHCRHGVLNAKASSSRTCRCVLLPADLVLSVSAGGILHNRFHAPH